MAAALNRRRSSRNKKGKSDSSNDSDWVSASSRTPASTPVPQSFYKGLYDDDEPAEPRSNLLHQIWLRFNIWSLLATLLFLTFTGMLYIALFRLWTPQDIKRVAGYQDQGLVTDIKAKLDNANGEEISFTEEEINRYVAHTCRVRQTGIFSIIAHAEGVAFQLHDGYVEMIVDRVVGSNIHQTTSVNISIRREEEHGVPYLKVELQNGSRLVDSVPDGGCIGMVKVPPRCTQMLKPTLESLLSCHPDIVNMIKEKQYLPVFTEGKVTLVPLEQHNLLPEQP